MGFDFKPLASHRREYGEQSLDEATLSDCPLLQFEQWMSDALAEEKQVDPTAMVLSTVDAHGHPNSRVVLLKGLEDGTFIFYTNYESTKGEELLKTPYAALNFYWPILARQVRVRGRVKRVARETSSAYFQSRSMMSQCSAVVSPQSQVIDSREKLVKQAEKLMLMSKVKSVSCPEYWGGFSVSPDEVEFWQGRDYRLHDRILYKKKKSNWSISRLAS